MVILIFENLDLFAEADKQTKIHNLVEEKMVSTSFSWVLTALLLKISIMVGWTAYNLFLKF
jgi:hypothetical protein